MYYRAFHFTDTLLIDFFLMFAVSKVDFAQYLKVTNCKFYASKLVDSFIVNFRSMLFLCDLDLAIHRLQDDLPVKHKNKYLLNSGPLWRHDGRSHGTSTSYHGCLWYGYLSRRRHDLLAAFPLSLLACFFEITFSTYLIKLSNKLPSLFCTQSRSLLPSAGFSCRKLYHDLFSPSFRLPFFSGIPV